MLQNDTRTDDSKIYAKSHTKAFFPSRFANTCNLSCRNKWNMWEMMEFSGDGGEKERFEVG